MILSGLILVALGEEAKARAFYETVEERIGDRPVMPDILELWTKLGEALEGDDGD